MIGNFDILNVLHLQTYTPSNEPPHGKTNNLHRRKQRRRSASLTAKLISAFVFATWIVQFLYFLNPNCPSLAIFFDCTGRFVSDLFKNHIVGFSMRRFKSLWEILTTFILRIARLMPWPRGFKTFFMLNSAETKIYPAHNVKMPTFVGILTFMSRINF